MNLEMVAVENNCYSNSNSLNAYAKILEEIMDDLALLDIEVLVAHKETGPGQFEIVLGYGDVMETLDKYFLARETIKAVFGKYSYIVTFIPKSSSIT
jgi:glutamine synthetase